MPPEDLRKNDREFIKSSAKLFEVLELYAARRRELSLNQVLAELAYPKTSAHRLIYSLEKLGYLEKGGRHGAYRLGQRFFSLSDGSTSHRRLRVMARPIMEELASKVGETINLGILDSDEVVLLEVVNSPSRIRWVSEAGERSHIHTTALGKAIAAFLPEAELERALNRKGLVRLTSHTLTKRAPLVRQLRSARRQLVAYDHEETALGAQCLASPVFDSASRVIGALSISGPKDRMIKHVAKHKRHVREAALTLSRALGHEG